jgi:hypothetical protein
MFFFHNGLLKTNDFVQEIIFKRMVLQRILLRRTVSHKKTNGLLQKKTKCFFFYLHVVQDGHALLQGSGLVLLERLFDFRLAGRFHAENGLLLQRR